VEMLHVPTTLSMFSKHIAFQAIVVARLNVC
jgi:hypothetical protein